MARIVSTGKTLSSPEYQQKKKEYKKRQIILWSLAILSILVLFVVVSRFEKLRVDEIKVVGAQVLTDEEISNNVLETLSGKYLWLIPKANAVLVPRALVEKNLNREFPRLSTISLSLDNAKTLSVEVEERKPFALYCPSAERPDDASACFFLDEEGLIFDEAPAFSGVVYFVYAKVPTIEKPKGATFLEADKFKDLSGFIQSLKVLGIEPLAASIGEREVNLMLPKGAKIIWNTKDDLPTLYSNLQSFLNTDEIRKDKEFLKKVKVLDLRTRNKVFFRFNE